MFDVVIVDYGTPRLAARCAGSLDHELVSSIEIVDAKARHLSYAVAVNETLAVGESPFVLACNADTRMLDPDGLMRIFQIFHENTNIATIGPRQIDDQGRITHAGIVGNDLQRAHRFWFEPIGAVEDQCSERILDVPTVSGAVYFCRRKAWEQVGGFLETDHFYEETGCDLKLRHAGWRVVYTGAVTWEHLFNRSPTTEAWRVKKMVASREKWYALGRELGVRVGG